MSDSSAVGRFVGRAAELDVVDRALRTAAAGAGGLLLVGGEAGIGKSRLLDEAARRARRLGVAVLGADLVTSVAVELVLMPLLSIWLVRTVRAAAPEPAPSLARAA